MSCDVFNQNLDFFQNLQLHLADALAREDGTAGFVTDEWSGKLGNGRSMVLKQGAVFEQAGVNFSHEARRWLCHEYHLCRNICAP